MSDAAFRFISPHLPNDQVWVASFRGTEAMNAAYHFEIVCRARLSAGALAALDATLLGSRLSLDLGGGSHDSRWVHGVVTELAIEAASSAGETDVRVRLEPRLSLLKLNTKSAVHQEITVPDVVTQLLDRWQIAHESRLSASYDKRVFLTQYQETDYAFLLRVLASVGIFFYFEQTAPLDPRAPAEERVVLSDDAGLYAPLAGNAHVRFQGDGGALREAASFDHIAHFTRLGRVAPARSLLGDYDFRNPGLPLTVSAQAAPGPELGASPDQLRAYHHHPHAEIESTSGSAEREARRARSVLESHRVHAETARGAGHSRRLMVGHTFVLEDHPVEHHNRGYAVTKLEHEGRVPSLTGGDEGAPVYSNRFECVPDTVPARASMVVARRRQVAETATVVGVGGEDIHCDDQGRIKVKFHWDLAESVDDKSSCWLRVAQSWAGTHFGAQFIPRVGDEVIVTFLGGDPDRPIVTGSVYNSTHPHPFDLPDEKTTSGFRTQSTPGGSGYNELSFCDRGGDERIFMRAERDLVQEVQNDHTLKVDRDQKVTVLGSQLFRVAAAQVLQIGGAQKVTVEGNMELAAGGSSLLAYRGDADVQVGQQLTTRVDGREHKEVRGQANAIYRDDWVNRVLGHATTIVGAHDARRAFNVHVEGTLTSFSSGAMDLSSDKSIELRVGKSVVRITEDAIELDAPTLRLRAEDFEFRASKTIALEAQKQVALKSDKVLMESEAAFLGLGKVAKLKGELVKLNCEDDPVDALDPPEAPELTTIELTDEAGKPIANQRFVLVLPDGTEQTGTLDNNGRAQVVASASGSVIFPDVHNPRPA
jgi:type VI secretion system secreted protein VgrG